jgi:methylenetetrahydrofolate dehydrogenase (NADP+) / methenyltetrahydrofolate cyclohydrolase / formyltetrahydrofolate synthetase
VTPGLPIPDVYRTENVDLVKAGCANMAKHVQNAIKFGVPVVVAINKFAYLTSITELIIVPTLMLN